MHVRSTRTALVIIGAGPAGLAPLFAAAETGRLQELLRAGVTILERGERLGCGSFGQYAIRSDSSAESLIEIVTRSREAALQNLSAHPVTAELASYGKGPAPLRLVADFLELAGNVMCRLVRESDHGVVFTGVEAVSVQRVSSSHWRIRLRHLKSLSESVLDSQCVVVATGAEQPRERLRIEEVGGATLLPRFEEKLLQSGDVLTHEGCGRVQRRLAGIARPKIAIIGGSTSAASLAGLLLSQMPAGLLAEGSVTILHRRRLNIFYETVAEALADGYTEFKPDDVCRLTGRVFRLSGFRTDSRDLIMGARGIGGRPADPRLKLFPLDENDTADAERLLLEADLIIAAFGYRPRLVRVLDTHSRELSLLRPEGSRWAVVDGRCRMLAADASPLPGLFAMGLAVGPGASWEHGGELGFQGQINSLWLWQHRLGLILFEEVMMRVRQDLEMKFNSLGSSSLAAAGSSSAVNADAHLNGRGV